MCLMAASKYDELDDRIPMIKELQKLAKFAFTYKEGLEGEGEVLMQLNWNLNVITPLHFVQSLVGMGVIFENDKIGEL